LYIAAPYSLITDVTEPGERSKFFGYLVGLRAVGSLLGPLMTGALMDAGYSNLGWIVSAPFMIIAVPVIIALYPNIKTQRAVGKFDFGGVLLLFLSLSGIVFLLSLGGKIFDWISPVSAVLLVAGVVGIFFLIRRESKHPNPSVPINVFRHSRFALVFICIMLTVSYNTCAASYSIAYAQQVMQVSSTLSGTVTMPQTIIQAICSGFIGAFIGKKFAKRFRPMTMLSLAMITVGALLLFLLKPSSPMILIYAATFIGGFGVITPQAAFTPYFQMQLKPEEYRSAQSMFAFANSGGACIFGALAGMILNAGMGFNQVFLLATIMCTIALVIGFFGMRLPKESTSEAA